MTDETGRCRVRRWSGTIVTAMVLLCVPAPALAGGAELELSREFYLPGDVVRAHSSVWLKSSMGRLEDGPYFAYLSRVTKGMPTPLSPDAVRVARVEVVPRPTGEHGDASVEFVVPQVEPGRYWITICNSGCKVTLGDIVSTEMLVAGDEDEGRMAVLRDDFDQEIFQLEFLLRERVLGRDPDTVRSRVTSLEEDLALLREEVADLRAAARRPAPPEEDRSSMVPPLLAFVVPAAAAGILVARRYRSTG
ncbi:MAG TPA: hypothetical protein VHN37_05095 [Actinomycetota bacterium]|nr:hypothetical protein [Actinomycetota bacterium]